MASKLALSASNVAETAWLLIDCDLSGQRWSVSET